MEGKWMKNEYLLPSSSPSFLRSKRKEALVQFGRILA